MAVRVAASSLALLLLVVASLAFTAAGASKALELVPYITCGVCETLAKHIHVELKRAREELPTYKTRVSEEALQNLVENVCNHSRSRGSWLRSLDIVLRLKSDVNHRAYLHVVDRAPGLRDCGTNGASMSSIDSGPHARDAGVNHECTAIRKACTRMLEDNDMDLAEYLTTHQETMSRAKVTNKLCYELNKGACGGRGGKNVKQDDGDGGEEEKRDALARYRSLPADLRLDAFLAAGARGDAEAAGPEDASTDDDGRLLLSPFAYLNEQEVELDKVVMEMQNSMPDGQKLNYEVKRREDILEEIEKDPNYGEL